MAKIALALDPMIDFPYLSFRTSSVEHIIYALSQHFQTLSRLNTQLTADSNYNRLIVSKVFELKSRIDTKKTKVSVAKLCRKPRLNRGLSLPFVRKRAIDSNDFMQIISRSFSQCFALGLIKD